MPHTFVIRGDRKGKVSLGESTCMEYFCALYRMCKDSSVPHIWVGHIREHQEQLAIMHLEWDWETSLMWSERVFSMIDDGRLKKGWEDLYAIKDVQRDVHSVGTRITQKKRKPDNYKRSEETNTYEYTKRAEFSSETDGRPCHQWNWGTDCGHTATHGTLPNRFCHVCAYCANKYRKANPHREQDCNNKKRANEKKKAAESTTDSAKDADQQGFQ